MKSDCLDVFFQFLYLEPSPVERGTPVSFSHDCSGAVCYSELKFGMTDPRSSRTLLIFLIFRLGQVTDAISKTLSGYKLLSLAMSVIGRNLERCQ